MCVMAQPQAQNKPSVFKDIGFRVIEISKQDCIGIGAYGSVYKAMCDDLLCAAKMIHPILVPPSTNTTADQGHRIPIRRFEAEFTFLRDIRHPNIVQYLGMYRDQETGLPVLLMELLDESLTHYLGNTEKSPPYHIQLDISFDITRALSFLHLNGIVHRDLSSNNILLTGKSCKAKLSDFGMAKFLNANMSRISHTALPGTDVYMPPEAIDGQTSFTESGDIFSFGVIVVQILTRKFPAPGDRFQHVPVSDPHFPSGTVRTFVSEVQRRSNHISTIDQSHTLLPLALGCLKDKQSERPTTSDLCKSLCSLRSTPEYTKSECQTKERNDINNGSFEVLNVDQKGKQKIECLQTTLEDKRQLIEAKDNLLEAKENVLKRLQHELEKTETQRLKNEQEIQDLHKELEKRKGDSDQKQRDQKEEILKLQKKIDEIESKTSLSTGIHPPEATSKGKKKRREPDYDDYVHIEAVPNMKPGSNQGSLADKGKSVGNQDKKEFKQAVPNTKASPQQGSLADNSGGDNDKKRPKWKEDNTCATLRSDRKQQAGISQSTVASDFVRPKVQKPLSSDNSVRQIMRDPHNTHHSMYDKRKPYTFEANLFDDDDGEFNSFFGGTKPTKPTKSEIDLKKRRQEEELDQLEKKCAHFKNHALAIDRRITQAIESDFTCMVPEENKVSSPRTPNAEPISLKWRLGKGAPCTMYSDTCAVANGKTAYFRPGMSKKIYSFDSTANTWENLPDCPTTFPALAIVNRVLTTVGGIGSNDVYSFKENGRKRKWIKDLPSLTTNRHLPIAVGTEKALIVAGGKSGRQNLNSLEILFTDTKQWLQSGDLPEPLHFTSAAVCGDHVFLLGDSTVYTYSISSMVQSHSRKSFLGSLFSSASPTREPAWCKIRNVPVSAATLVSIHDRVFAIGGLDLIGNLTAGVYVYNNSTKNWHALPNSLNEPRHRCFAIALPKRIMLVGGYTTRQALLESDVVEFGYCEMS